MRCLVAGGTGFIGRHLVQKLENPVVLGRNKERIQNLFSHVTPQQWTPGKPIDSRVFDDCDTIINLAGDSLYNERWNSAKKKRILDSRVNTTQAIVAALEKLPEPPKTFISTSAIGYYGSRGDEQLTESASAGSDFLSGVCVAWENEAREAEKLGVRVILLRIGVVLGKDGGALEQMLLPFKLGLGGRLGNGKQYMSWIHIEDMTGLILYAAENKNMHGPYNAVSPQPVTNSEFTKTLAAALHRPAFLPTCK